ncbi:MAG: 4-hydroxy-tetrahydrodipicolinate reductase [Bacteroidales bacterium]|nr:4-hydroxy-tetrahydrodipicolinate reductase [Bacteroidales bacterium]
MKIALIGYGKMGREIERIARDRGHEIVATIDMNEEEKFHSDEFKSADVAIEFTSPASAFQNYIHAFEAGVPVVSGTTGWLDRIDQIKEACEKEGKTFFYASNFSLGVNLFFALNNYLAGLMNLFTDYDARIEETHHIHKLDAPSGTAITLAEGILERVERKKEWSLDKKEADTLHIESFREGEVPGIHTVVYESPVDSIRLTHDAKSREGFALGAVLAAEFTKGKKGFLGMEDLLNLQATP